MLYEVSYLQCSAGNFPPTVVVPDQAEIKSLAKTVPATCSWNHQAPAPLWHGIREQTGNRPHWNRQETGHWPFLSQTILWPAVYCNCSLVKSSTCNTIYNISVLVCTVVVFSGSVLRLMCPVKGERHGLELSHFSVSFLSKLCIIVKWMLLLSERTGSLFSSVSFPSK